MNDYRKIPEGPRGRDFVEDEEPNPGIEADWAKYGPISAVPDISLRWQMKGPKGETFIMYGAQLDCLARAMIANYTDFRESGWYSYATNSIVDPKDGPTTFIDNRKSGGGSQG